MATVVSSIVFTRPDIAGNPRVEGWFLIEFRDANYTPGGENLALNTHMQTIETWMATPASGQHQFLVHQNSADLPGQAGSTRATLHYLASAIVAVNMSGLGIQVASGRLLTTSAWTGLQSGNAVMAVLFSGAIAAVASGDVAIANAGFYTEVLSGVAVSGARAWLHAIGT